MSLFKGVDRSGIVLGDVCLISAVDMLFVAVLCLPLHDIRPASCFVHLI